MRIKGFDKNMQCRGTQFKIGESCEIPLNGNKPELYTNTCYHYGADIEEVNEFYSANPMAQNRFCEVVALGDEITDGKIYGSNHIKIIREIINEELDVLRGNINGNLGVFNIGDYNIGHRNHGNCNLGSHNIGDHNLGSFNEGSRNMGSRNMGSHNSGSDNHGNYNSGEKNLGSGNSGWRNIGLFNSGHKNYGDHNSGDFNQGDHNSGVFNKCNHSSGVFCNKPHTIKIFNMDSGLTLDEFYRSKYYNAIISARFPLTTAKLSKYGELTTITFKEACKLWWKDMTYANKKIIKSLPNFDTKIFYDITGIRTRKRVKE